MPPAHRGRPRRRTPPGQWCCGTPSARARGVPRGSGSRPRWGSQRTGTSATCASPMAVPARSTSATRSPSRYADRGIGEADRRPGMMPSERRARRSCVRSSTCVGRGGRRSMPRRAMRGVMCRRRRKRRRSGKSQPLSAYSLSGRRLRGAAWGTDRRDAGDQRDEDLVVVEVRPRDRDDQRQPGRVGQDMDLRALLAAVDRVWTGQGSPFFARRLAAFTITDDQSTPPAPPWTSRISWCSRDQTLARVQAWKRRCAVGTDTPNPTTGRSQPRTGTCCSTRTPCAPGVCAEVASKSPTRSGPPASSSASRRPTGPPR